MYKLTITVLLQLHLVSILIQCRTSVSVLPFSPILFLSSFLSLHSPPSLFLFHLFLPLLPLSFLLLCLSAVSEVPQRAVFLPSVTVKEGYLQKHKAESPQLLSRFSFKKRYFWLSSETLSYAKTLDPWQV